jgi:hypothetical protein
MLDIVAVTAPFFGLLPAASRASSCSARSARS